MIDGQTKQAKIEEEKQKSGDQKQIDKIGETNIYPVSEMEDASRKAEVHTPGDLGKPGQAGETEKDNR